MKKLFIFIILSVYGACGCECKPTSNASPLSLSDKKSRETCCKMTRLFKECSWLGQDCATGKRDRSVEMDIEPAESERVVKSRKMGEESLSKIADTGGYGEKTKRKCIAQIPGTDRKIDLDELDSISQLPLKQSKYVVEAFYEMIKNRQKVFVSHFYNAQSLEDYIKSGKITDVMSRAPLTKVLLYRVRGCNLVPEANLDEFPHFKQVGHIYKIEGKVFYPGTKEVELLQENYGFMSDDDWDQFEKMSMDPLFASVETIIINNVKFWAIPEFIGNFKNLKNLMIPDSNIDFVPEIIGALPLIQLDLQNNQIEDFPEAIFNLKGLITLNLSENKINEIPEDISQLSQLKILDVSYNKIRYIPETIDGLKNLEVLNLSHNELGVDSLVDSMDKLEKLINLDLSTNDLEDVDILVDIAHMDSLEYLNLSDNYLKEVIAFLVPLQADKTIVFGKQRDL